MWPDGSTEQERLQRTLNIARTLPPGAPRQRYIEESLDSETLAQIKALPEPEHDPPGAMPEHDRELRAAMRAFTKAFQQAVERPAKQIRPKRTKRELAHGRGGPRLIAQYINRQETPA